MANSKKHSQRRAWRPCRACHGAGVLAFGDRVTVCRKCRGTGTARNK